MNKLIFILFLLFLFISVMLGTLYIPGLLGKKGNKSVSITELAKPIQNTLTRPLDAYTIENLSTRKYDGSDIVFDEEVASESAYIVKSFHFQSDGKRVSGLAHVPPFGDHFPVVVQFRGYVEKDMYQPGVGSARSGAYFAQHGYLALAPDFLGYGASDEAAGDIFENRFETYTTAMNLMASISRIPQADIQRVFLWGHSNGGHIGLTALELYDEATKSSALPNILGAVFWAPVTKPFPYSILYYTDEAPDEGKYLRGQLADFETVYDVQKYSLTRYLDRLSVPIVIHQGTKDEAVPEMWSRHFVLKLRAMDKDVDYLTHEAADHNLSGAWEGVIAYDVDRFKQWEQEAAAKKILP
jgi:dipeptidyl aminopeptidase/acylaminoacyl peptidase